MTKTLKEQTLEEVLLDGIIRLKQIMDRLDGVGNVEVPDDNRNKRD